MVLRAPYGMSSTDLACAATRRPRRHEEWPGISLRYAVPGTGIAFRAYARATQCPVLTSCTMAAPPGSGGPRKIRRVRERIDGGGEQDVD
eukprot:3941625-Rhodomonas_salina.1